MGCPYPCIYRWKPGVATWARDLPKVGFGHQEESNPDSRGKRRRLWRQGETPGTMAFPPVPQVKSFSADLRPCGPSNLAYLRFPRLGEFYNPPDTSISSREPSGTSRNISGSPGTISQCFVTFQTPITEWCKTFRDYHGCLVTTSRVFLNVPESSETIRYYLEHFHYYPEHFRFHPKQFQYPLSFHLLVL